MLTVSEQDGGQIIVVGVISFSLDFEPLACHTPQMVYLERQTSPCKCFQYAYYLLCKHRFSPM